MSAFAARSLYSFDRIKITGQQFDREADRIVLTAAPDRAYDPFCHACGGGEHTLHTTDRRSIRDLPVGSTPVEIDCAFRKIHCKNCDRIRNEDLGFFGTYDRYTKRMKRFIYELSRIMNHQQVADSLDLSWRTVRDIVRDLEGTNEPSDDERGIRVLGVKEFPMGNRDAYRIVVIDYDSGHVLWNVEGRENGLRSFFDEMSGSDRDRIESITMEMHNPCVRVVQEELPNAEMALMSLVF